MNSYNADQAIYVNATSSMVNGITADNAQSVIAQSFTYELPDNVEIATNFHVPNRATEGSAGYDLRADVKNPTTILPGQTVAIPTGFRMRMPSDMAAMILPRSGMAARNGVTVANAPGLIDSDYRGEVAVLLVNHSDKPYTVFPADRIAQMVFITVRKPTFSVSDVANDTARGTGGFGSTGV